MWDDWLLRGYLLWLRLKAFMLLSIVRRSQKYGTTSMGADPCGSMGAE